MSDRQIEMLLSRFLRKYQFSKKGDQHNAIIDAWDKVVAPAIKKLSKRVKK